MKPLKTSTKEQEESDVETLVADTFALNLVVFNDDVNTFEWVIDSLVDVCNHSEAQAEQCAYIIHYKGKCVVKSGDLEILSPMHRALCDRGLSAEIQ